MVFCRELNKSEQSEVDKTFEISNLELITDMEKIIIMEQALSLKTIKLQF